MVMIILGIPSDTLNFQEWIQLGPWVLNITHNDLYFRYGFIWDRIAYVKERIKAMGHLDFYSEERMDLIILYTKF